MSKTNTQNPVEKQPPFHEVGSPENATRGRKLIRQGKVGCLIVAGGQGTRLGFNGPKGMFPISVIKHKTLFQLFAEKTLAASENLPLAIMTSPLNDKQTRDFFKGHNDFGLKHISFFTQGMLPFENQDGNPIEETGPDGNGRALHHFVNSSIWKQWHDQGVRYLNFVLVDNPLADPFDGELIGFHDRMRSDVVVKCIKRTDPDEKVGIIIEQEGEVHVVEYSELSDDERSLKHPLANISLFSFTMDFVKQASEATLPIHRTLKAISPGKPKAWKSEYFIFDVLSLAKKVDILLYPREICFAPLKNATGKDSPETVQAALQERDRQHYQQMTGKKPPNQPFELSQEGHMYHL